MVLGLKGSEINNQTQIKLTGLAFFRTGECRSLICEALFKNCHDDRERVKPETNIFLHFPGSFDLIKDPLQVLEYATLNSEENKTPLTECDICTNLLNCICGYCEKCIDTSVVCEAKNGAVGGVLLNTVGVWVHAAACLQVRRPLLLSRRLFDRSRGIPCLWEVSQKRTLSDR